MSNKMKGKLAIEVVFLLGLIFASIFVSYIRPTLSAETCPCNDCDSASVETLHNVTVYLVDDEVLIRIEPLNLPETCCCGECETCPGVEPENVQFTVLEEEDGHTVVLITYEVNGTVFEVTISKTLLWSYSEAGEANRTASFNSIEITANGVSTQLYSLTYSVWSAPYNLSLSTWLDPLDEKTYNSSFTVISYAPAEKSLQTLEFVQFNSSVTLSQQYALLGDVAKAIGKHYEKSQNQTLQALAQNYNNMKEEAKYLSKLVGKNLQEYDDEILRTSAILMDDFWSCLACQIAVKAALAGGCVLLCITTAGLACYYCWVVIGYPYSLIIGLGIYGFCQWVGWCP